MNTYKGLINDIDVMLERLDVNNVAGKSFRQLSNTLEVVFKLLSQRFVTKSESHDDDLLKIKANVSKIITDVEEVKTSLLEKGNDRHYYDVVMGYEKLLKIKQNIKYHFTVQERDKRLNQKHSTTK